jgi:hypothetical protein
MRRAAAAPQRCCGFGCLRLGRGSLDSAMRRCSTPSLHRSLKKASCCLRPADTALRRRAARPARRSAPEKKHDLTGYIYSKTAPNRAMIWEPPIQHSLRPTRKSGGKTGGFVLPYRGLLAEQPQALTICSGDLPLARSNERRRTLPSIATTPHPPCLDLCSVHSLGPDRETVGAMERPSIYHRMRRWKP